MQKIGMAHEGTVREGELKGDAFEDLELYAILR
jgi:RimJ/RimL family protein N-acetyltransferase